MTGPRAARPLALDFEVLAGPVETDDNPLEDEPGNGLAVRPCRCGGMPERWYVRCELLDGSQLRRV